MLSSRPKRSLSQHANAEPQIKLKPREYPYGLPGKAHRVLAAPGVNRPRAGQYAPTVDWVGSRFEDDLAEVPEQLRKLD